MTERTTPDDSTCEYGRPDCCWVLGGADMSVTPEFIVEQRAKGWPDIHPEDYCHRCGRPNPTWFSPEFVALVGSFSGILCPSCFAALDPDPNAIWCFTRTVDDDSGQERLAAILSGCLDDPSDAHRIAGCIVQAGWRGRSSEETP